MDRNKGKWASVSEAIAASDLFVSLISISLHVWYLDAYVANLLSPLFRFFFFFSSFLLSIFYQSFQSDHPKEVYQHVFSLAPYLFSLPALCKDLSSYATISFMFWVISIPPPLSCCPFLIWFKEVPPFSFISPLAFVLYFFLSFIASQIFPSYCLFLSIPF